MCDITQQYATNTPLNPESTLCPLELTEEVEASEENFYIYQQVFQSTHMFFFPDYSTVSRYNG